MPRCWKRSETAIARGEPAHRGRSELADGGFRPQDDCSQNRWGRSSDELLAGRDGGIVAG
jgi:hypothetical protein